MDVARGHTFQYAPGHIEKIRARLTKGWSGQERFGKYPRLNRLKSTREGFDSLTAIPLTAVSVMSFGTTRSEI